MTPLHTRQALSEIPERLEQLRVGEIPTVADFADEPIAANILNPTIIGGLNNSVNSPSSVVQSPDEIVIRQRGRRRISLTWSPDKTSSRYLQRTPTKVNCSSMVLRSSPRKRLMLNESINSPRKSDISWKSDIDSDKDGRTEYSSPVIKRMKFEETPFAQNNTNIALPVILKGLSQSQLIEIITNIVRIEPYLEKKIRNEIPLPDLSSFEDQLIKTKKNIFKSLPSSRLSEKTDSTAYSRAAIHVSEFKRNIVNHCRILSESKHWDALIDYINIAWRYVRATPIWDNHSHNAVRRQCFKILSCQCTTALRNGGIYLGQERLNMLLENIKDMSKDYEDIKLCIATIDQLLSKF